MTETAASKIYTAELELQLERRRTKIMHDQLAELYELHRIAAEEPLDVISSPKLLTRTVDAWRNTSNILSSSDSPK